MVLKQTFPMETLIKALRVCGGKGGCLPDCPFFNNDLDQCNEMNLQAADLLEIMSKLLKTQNITL